MTATYSEAVDQINARFWTDWNSTLTSNIVGIVPTVVWRGVEQPAKLNDGDFWCRHSVLIAYESQTSFGGCGNGQSRYTADGIVFIQLFCPKSNSRASELGRQLAEVARNSYRGKTTNGKVVFKNVRINDVEPEQLYYRFNVIAEFEYDDIG